MTPYYRVTGREEEVFLAAYAERLPVLLKGPTGCGKSRFVEAMGHKLGREVITVACNDETSAADLLGRWLVQGGDTVWQDGPVTRAVREGAILYLDEVAEAREDVIVVLHPLTDHRRTLPLDKKGELIHAHPDFQLVISYNPGYQTLMKDLKQSTKQRFTGFDFDYPDAALEAQIVATETGADAALAAQLVKIGGVARNLKGHGLDEGISTRLLVYAATLIKDGVDPRDACRMALVRPITDDADIRETLDHAIDATFA